MGCGEDDSLIRRYVLWSLHRADLTGLGPDAGATITSLLQTGTEVFAAAAHRIIRYVRGKEVS